MELEDADAEVDLRDAEIMEVEPQWLEGTNGESEGFIFERGAVVLKLFALAAASSRPVVGNDYNF